MDTNVEQVSIMGLLRRHGVVTTVRIIDGRFYQLTSLKDLRGFFNVVQRTKDLIREKDEAIRELEHIAVNLLERLRQVDEDAPGSILYAIGGKITHYGHKAEHKLPE